MKGTCYLTLLFYLVMYIVILAEELSLYLEYFF